MRIQIHHAACLAHHLATVRIQHRTAAGSNHHIAAVTQFSHHLRLTGAEADLTFDFEDHRHLYAGSCLDFVVGIMKWPLKCTSQQATNGGLACAHEANEDDVIGHDREVYQSPCRQKKAGQSPGLFRNVGPVTARPSDR